MSSTYVQHEYCVQPWSLNSNNTELSSVLDGDEELLVLDNSKLGFDDDFIQEEEDFCRCDNCSTKNQLNCSSNNNNIDSNSNGIAMISSGSVIDEVNNWNRMSSNNTLEPSTVTYTHLNHHISDGPNLTSEDHNGHSHGHHNNGHHSHGHSSGDHNWLTHCHPSQAIGRSKEVIKANRQLLISCLLCLVFMLAEIIGGFLSNSLAIMTGQLKHILINIRVKQFINSFIIVSEIHDSLT